MADNHTDNLLVEIRDVLHRIEQLMLQQVEKQVKVEQKAKALDPYYKALAGKYKVIHLPIEEGTTQDDTPNSDTIQRHT